MTEKEKSPVQLRAGVVNTINNPNPMTWDVEIETAGGSIIAFTVPAGGKFSIKPNEPLRRVDIHCGELRPFGPRAVDTD
ncbi:MAG: hypothetical protein E2593_07025 [Stenotrophomonas sp.]|nr:hypothetical protein [Stenotrophomonas sp.]